MLDFIPSFSSVLFVYIVIYKNVSTSRCTVPKMPGEIPGQKEILKSMALKASVQGRRLLTICCRGGSPWPWSGGGLPDPCPHAWSQEGLYWRTAARSTACSAPAQTGLREAERHVCASAAQVTENTNPTMSGNNYAIQGSHLQIYLPGRFKTFYCRLSQCKSGKTHTEHVPHTFNCLTSDQSFIFTLTDIPNLKISDPI